MIPQNRLDSLLKLAEAARQDQSLLSNHKGTVDKDLSRERAEIGRLFGGAYSTSRLRTAAKDAPIREMIRKGRIRYSEIRQALNLPVVENWDVRPEQLVQHVNVE